MFLQNALRHRSRAIFGAGPSVSAILLNQPFAVGYYHFVVDVLPRLIIAMDHLSASKGAGRIKFILPSDGSNDDSGGGGGSGSGNLADGPLKPYMCQFMERLSIASHDVLLYPIHRNEMNSAFRGRLAASYDSLYVVDWGDSAARSSGDQACDCGSRHDRMSGDTQHVPPRHALLRLRHAMTAKAMAQKDTPESSSSSSSRSSTKTILFVQRASASSRRLDGEDRLLSQLRELTRSANQRSNSAKWQVRLFTDKKGQGADVDETIHLFSTAQIVIGVHGAGLANIAFCPAGTLVVELVLPQPHAQYYSAIAAALGLTYRSSVPVTPVGEGTAYNAVSVSAGFEHVKQVVAATMNTM
jgi:hypothetical protein